MLLRRQMTMKNIDPRLFSLIQLTTTLSSNSILHLWTEFLFQFLFHFDPLVVFLFSLIIRMDYYSKIYSLKYDILKLKKSQGNKKKFKRKEQQNWKEIIRSFLRHDRKVNLLIPVVFLRLPPGPYFCNQMFWDRTFSLLYDGPILFPEKTYFSSITFIYKA